MSSTSWTRYKQRVFDDLTKQTQASNELVTSLRNLGVPPTTSSDPSDEMFDRKIAVQLAGTKCTLRAKTFLTSLLHKLGGPLDEFATLPTTRSVDTNTAPSQVTETDLLSATQRYHTAVVVLQEHCSGFTAAESSAFVEQKVSELTEWYESYTNLDSTLKEFEKALRAEATSGSGDGELIPRDPE